MQRKEDSDPISVILVCWILTVCVMLFFTDRIVTQDEITRSQNICESANSSLAWFEINTHEIEVTCKSGAKFIISIDTSVSFGTSIETEENLKNGDSYE